MSAIGMRPVPTWKSTDAAPTPTSGAGYTSPEKEVPLDPSTVKKSDLISVLSQHAKEHGDFDMDIESIANFLMAE